MQDNPAGEVTEWWLHAPTALLVHRPARHAHRSDSGDHDGARVHGAAGTELRWRGRRRRRASGRASGCWSTRAGPSNSPSKAAATGASRATSSPARSPAAVEWLLSRSFKYHRPRGILSMAGHDANTLVQLPDEPNVLADRQPHRAGPRGQWPELPRLARPRPRRVVASVRPFPAGRLLLSSVSPPEGRVEALGADHPQLRGSRQSEPERAASLLRQGLRFLRSWSWSAAGRPA